MRSIIAVLALIILAACGAESTGVVPPKTLAEAAKAYDAAITAMNWAQQDYWKAGGRDIIVSVQIDTSLAPNYFRLPRKP